MAEPPLVWIDLMKGLNLEPQQGPVCAAISPW